MLYKSCFSKSAIYQGNMPDNYNWGDVLMVNTIQLQKQFRGYGIGLLALDRLVKHVAQASPEWTSEGLIVLEPSGMADHTVRICPDKHEETQGKLVQYYELFGLWPLARETREHCAFVGHEMMFERPEISTVVPHLL
jgi:hypothetical protein